MLTRLSAGCSRICSASSSSDSHTGITNSPSKTKCEESDAGLRRPFLPPPSGEAEPRNAVRVGGAVSPPSIAAKGPPHHLDHLQKIPPDRPSPSPLPSAVT